MTILDILIWPDPELERVAGPVAEVNPEVVRLGKDMLDTMYAARGIGLAAPQVGQSLRLIVVDLNGSDPEEQNPGLGPYIMINPIITEREGKILFEEGCLSVPGETGEVERSQWIAVDFTGPDGTEYQLEAEDLLSVCIQHEIDHLEGIVFPERLKSHERARIRRAMRGLKQA